MGVCDITTDRAELFGDPCASYEAMLERLEALETDTHRHVPKETNILFADVEQRLPAT